MCRRHDGAAGGGAGAAALGGAAGAVGGGGDAAAARGSGQAQISKRLLKSVYFEDKQNTLAAQFQELLCTRSSNH